MIDWRLAQLVGQTVASAAPGGGELDAAREVEAFAARSAELVSEYTGLAGAESVPASETVDRSEWVAANLGSMRTVLDPVAERAAGGLAALGSPVRAAVGGLLALQVGAVSGYLAGRVLGQYEFPVLDPAAPARLLFVGPNLAVTARALEADPQSLVRWVALHETTHALQFAGVPWLREHLAGRVRELVSSLDVSVDPRRAFRVPGTEDVRALLDAVRRGELAQLAVPAAQRAVLEELQAFMALIEGYAEHVMDVVGAQLLPDLEALRAALRRRRQDRSGLLRLLERLIGLDLKLRQYEQGKRFCDEVVALGGIGALNRAWRRPEDLPRHGELDDAAAWIERTRPRELPAAS